MYNVVSSVTFPAPQGLRVNMMPIVMGDHATVPPELRGYTGLIDLCTFDPGSTVYLTVDESQVLRGQTQRRPGVHTDGVKIDARKRSIPANWGGGWGGGSQPAPKPKPSTGAFGGGNAGAFGGGNSGVFGGGEPKTFGGVQRHEGIYIASTDGATRLWDTQTWDVDHLGACAAPALPEVRMAPSMLTWITDRTPHEALPAEVDGYRQFFRLVSANVYGWFAKHSTPNPLGVPPAVPIFTHSKFEG